MKNPRYKTTYLIFICTIITTIVTKELILGDSLSAQDVNAQTINLAGRQRLSSQRISKHLLLLDHVNYNLKSTYTNANLAVQINEFQNANNFLKATKIPYNPIYLESIFLNLVTNSIRYKSPDRSLKIAITTVHKNGKTQLIFQDNGIGINMERNGDKLFGLNKTFHKHLDAKGVGLFMTHT